MKKSSLYAIATGLILVFIALAWSGFSWHRIQNDLQHISHEGYQKKSATVSTDGITRLRINTSDVRISIQTQTDTNTIHVAYFSSKNDSFTVGSTDGTVTLSRTKPEAPHFMCIFRCIGNPNTITVYVPASSKYTYDLTADDITFDNTGTLQTQSVHIADNSSVRMQQLSTDGPMNISSDNGSIELHGVQTTGALSLTSSNGTSALTDVKAPSISSRADDGSVSLSTVTTNGLVVNASNGTITLNQLAAQHSTLTSDNGSVRGSLVGSKNEYMVKTSSDNGSIKINGASYDSSYFSDNNAAKSVEVHASNGTIMLDFTR